MSYTAEEDALIKAGRLREPQLSYRHIAQQILQRSGTERSEASLASRLRAISGRKVVPATASTVVDARGWSIEEDRELARAVTQQPDCATKKEMWQLVSKRMKASGFDRSPGSVEFRWRYMPGEQKTELATTPETSDGLDEDEDELATELSDREIAEAAVAGPSAKADKGKKRARSPSPPSSGSSAESIALSDLLSSPPKHISSSILLAIFSDFQALVKEHATAFEEDARTLHLGQAGTLAEMQEDVQRMALEIKRMRDESKAGRRAVFEVLSAELERWVEQ